jgi:hypothetical protein
MSGKFDNINGGRLDLINNQSFGIKISAPSQTER